MQPSTVILGVGGICIGLLIGSILPSDDSPNPGTIGPTIEAEPDRTIEPQESGRLRVEVETAPSEPEPMLPELARVLEQIGNDHEVLAYDWMPDLAKAQYLADMVANEPPFSTVYEALYELLTPARAAEVYSCMLNDVANGRLPEDYLTAPLTGKATLWDPVGRSYIEDALYGNLRISSGHAKDAFHDPIEREMLLGFSRSRVYSSHSLFPSGTTTSDTDKAAIEEIFERYERPLRDLIRAEEFFNAYLEAIDTEITTGQYEVVPSGVEANYLDHCRQDKGRRRVIDIQIGTGGWASCLIVYEGEYPKYDKLLNEVEALRLERDVEVKNYVMALR